MIQSSIHLCFEQQQNDLRKQIYVISDLSVGVFV